MSHNRIPKGRHLKWVSRGDKSPKVFPALSWLFGNGFSMFHYLGRKGSRRALEWLFSYRETTGPGEGAGVTPSQEDFAQLSFMAHTPWTPMCEITGRTVAAGHTACHPDVSKPVLCGFPDGPLESGFVQRPSKPDPQSFKRPGVLESCSSPNYNSHSRGSCGCPWS